MARFAPRMTVRCMLLIGGFLSAVSLMGVEPAEAGDKVQMCHFPPGDLANFHTITVGPNAVDMHVEKHDDLIGSCCESFEQLCDDGDACTSPSCLEDTCFNQPVDCDDSFSCTVASCDSSSGCANTPDDNLCAAGEICDPDDPGADSDTGCVAEASTLCPCAEAYVTPDFAGPECDPISVTITPLGETSMRQDCTDASGEHTNDLIRTLMDGTHLQVRCIAISDGVTIAHESFFDPEGATLPVHAACSAIIRARIADLDGSCQ